MTFPEETEKKEKKKKESFTSSDILYIDKKTGEQNENGDRRVNFKYFPPFQLELGTYLSRRSANPPPSTPFQPSLEFPFSLQLHRVTQTRHGKTRTEHGGGRRIVHVSSTLTTTVKKSFRSNGIVIFKQRIERTAGPLCSSCFFPNNLLLSPRPLLPRGITRQRFPLGNFSMRNEPTNLDASIPPLVQHFSLDFTRSFSTRIVAILYFIIIYLH